MRPGLLFAKFVEKGRYRIPSFFDNGAKKGDLRRNDSKMFDIFEIFRFTDIF